MTLATRLSGRRRGVTVVVVVVDTAGAGWADPTLRKGATVVPDVDGVVVSVVGVVVIDPKVVLVDPPEPGTMSAVTTGTMAGVGGAEGGVTGVEPAVVDVVTVPDCGPYQTTWKFPDWMRGGRSPTPQSKEKSARQALSCPVMSKVHTPLVPSMARVPLF